MQTNQVQILSLKPQKSNPNIRTINVIMGHIGSGKTTLLNKLCGTNRESGAATETVTRDLCIHGVIHGNYSSDLIDTPGNNSTIEAYKHAYLLRAALTTKKLNAIFIIIKYENRFINLANILEYQLDLIPKYESKVVVMISHWDQSKCPEKDSALIREVFQDFEIANIIWYSESSSNKELADLMHNCSSNIPADQLEISEEEFLLKFNVMEKKRAIKKMYDEFKKEVECLKSDFTSSIANLNQYIETEEDKDELIRIIIISFKNELDNILDQFQRKAGDSMNELNYYTFSIEMQKENILINDQFVQFARSKMSYDLFDKQDPCNLFRYCDFCGELWFKTEGCDNMTTCGSRSFGVFYELKNKYESFKPWFKWSVEWKRGKVSFVKPKAIAPVKKKEAWVATTKEKPRGCGQNIDWKIQKKVSKDTIMELFNVKSIEEVYKLINAEKFKVERNKFEKTMEEQVNCLKK